MLRGKGGAGGGKQDRRGWRGVKASDRGGVVLAGEVRKLVAHRHDHGWLAITILAFGLLRMLRIIKLTLRLRAQRMEGDGGERVTGAVEFGRTFLIADFKSISISLAVVDALPVVLLLRA